MTDGMKQFNDVTKKIAAETGVHFVDLDAAMPKTIEHMYDDCHYTAKGNELIAEELAKAIIAAELVPRGLDARKSAGNE
jgi:hypothetical protein